MERLESGGSGGIINKLATPSWRYRRIVIYSTLIFDLLVIGTILGGWLTGLRPDAAISVIAGLTITKDAAIIGSYVFGAAWTDISAMKHLSPFDFIGSGSGQSTRRI